MFWPAAEIAWNCNNNPDRSRTVIFWAATYLVRVGDVGAAVAGVPYAVSISVQLISVLDTLAVVQNVLQAC